MKTIPKGFLIFLLMAFVTFSCDAQCTNGTSSCTEGVPHFVKFNGALTHLAHTSRGGVVAIRFLIYGDSIGGTPLWQEIQNVPLDEQGHYEVMLGSTGSEGIPLDLFTSGEQRWLEIQALSPGEEAQPRVQLVSVPYALESANAQTLGGLPPSAFAKATPSSEVLNTSSAAVTPASSASLPVAGTGLMAGVPSATSVGQAVTTPGGTANTVPMFSAAASIVNSQITEQNKVVSVENLSNILFADRFQGGVPDAVAACATNGCIIYAVSPNVNLNLGNIDPGYKAITIYLGPYTYTVKQITLRKALKIIGMGASGGVNGSATCSVAAPCNGTTLQSINGNNPVIVIPQENNAPVANVQLSGFILLGAVGNTSEDAMFLDTSSTVNSGLWYSTLDDINIYGFAGIGIHIKGRNNDFLALTQWVQFNGVRVFRTAGGGNALRMEGAVFQLRFRNCQFDGQSAGDGTNVYLGGLAGGVSGYPLSIVFEGMVSQAANVAVQIDGGVNITFYGSHHEKLWGAYKVSSEIDFIGTRGLIISDSYFAGDVGINGGKGYELSIETTQAFGIVFTHNQMFVPDAVVRGTNLSSVVYQDNLYSGPAIVPPTSGITTQLAPAPSINIQGAHSIGLNPSSTPITTIQSSLGPGEMVTLFTFAGSVVFGAGGNINLMGLGTLTVNGSITFIRNDLTGGLLWTPVSQWSPPASPTSPTT